MPVHIDELQTDVTTEAPATPPPAAPAADEDWQQRERTRAWIERLAADRARTCAEGFDD